MQSAKSNSEVIDIPHDAFVKDYSFSVMTVFAKRRVQQYAVDVYSADTLSGSGCLQLNTPGGERRAGCSMRMKDLLIGNTVVMLSIF